MILSINQPAYLPWAGYFDRIAASDLHVVLDHVQFEKNSFTNRNRIRTPQGATWLTIPVSTSGQFGALPIHQLRTADGGRWRRKHLASLQANYARAPLFQTHFPAIEGLYTADAEAPEILPFLAASTAFQLSALNISTPLLSSGTMALHSTKSELVRDICLKLGAKTYLSGPFGRDYLDRDSFAKAGIAIKFHDYVPQPYPQAWPGFISHLAMIDALLCLPAEDARNIMMAGRQIRDA